MARAQVSGLAHVRLAKLSYFVAVGWSRTVWMWPDRERGSGTRKPRRFAGHAEDILSVSTPLIAPVIAL